MSGRRVRGAMVQGLDAGADLAGEPAWHGCWHDARLEYHGLDGGGVRADRGGRVALAGWVVCHDHHPEALVVSEKSPWRMSLASVNAIHCAQAARLVACADLLRP